jgi:hypothetical protein
MQVARGPSRRPYGLVLICLLVLCVTVPRYWQARNATRSRSDAASQPTVRHDGVGEGTIGGPSLVSPGSAAVLDGDLFAELICPPGWEGVEPSSPQPDPPWLGIPGVTTQRVTVWLETAGQRLAQCSPDELVTSVAQLAELCQESESETVAGRPVAEGPMLRPPGTHDRLARAIVPRLPRFSELADLPPPGDTQTTVWPWKLPVALLDQLQLLAKCPQVAGWAQETIAELKSLSDTRPVDRGHAAAVLKRLEQLAEEAARLAGSAEDDRLRVELLRAHWGLVRRLECWSNMHQIASSPASRERLAARGLLKGLLNGTPDTAAGVVDLHALSAGLESFEQSGDPSLGRSVREQQLRLLASQDTAERNLGEAVDKHYRNANVRIAVTGELLNRYLSQEQTTVEPVRDCIVGTPVRGRSETSSRSRARLEPSAGLLHVDLETDGSVNSNTLADGGKAVLHTLSTTDFWIEKPIIVDREAIRPQPTTADAENCAKLVGVKTSYDWVPLLREYAHSRAVKEYYAKRPRAKAEIECKVAARATRRVEDETDSTIDRVQEEVEERFTSRLSQYGVEITPLELTTTSDRLVARLRVAGNDQLAASSPRPRAPADSLASVQVHESALTNAALALDLNGKRLTAPELQESLRATFPRLAEKQPVREVHEDTVFDFADRDAVQFRVSQGRAEVIITLKEFIYEGKSARNFIVHAYYRPEVDGLDAKLVRDGALGVEGRLSSGDRARLHNVFETILPPDRTIPIFRVDDPDDARLAGLMITQVVLEDGWAGMALGPKGDGRTAQRWRSLR